MGSFAIVKTKRKNKKMKKLMMAVAVVVSATALNAATVNWQWDVMGAASTVFEANPTLVNNTKVYLFANYADDTAQFAAMDAVLADLRAGNEISGYTDHTTLDVNGLSTAKIYSNDFDGDNFMFTVVLAEGKDGSKWAAMNDIWGAPGLENGATPMSTDMHNWAADVDVYGLDTTPSAEGWGGWYQVSAVPEPTSGLLLLLGVAGLALRRRRA